MGDQINEGGTVFDKMEPPNAQDDAITEKSQPPNTPDTTKNKKATATVNEKAPIEREPVPGFTFLRTMKMRGLKKKSSGTGTAASAPSSVSTNLGSERDVDSKANDDLKITQTNGSGDGSHGVGTVEALHEVRSDDELLGEEGVSERQNGTAGEGVSGGEDVERTPSGRVYKVYKRRWFGLVQLVLLNIIVSWDVRCPKFSQPQLPIANAQHSGSPSLPIRRLQHNTTMSHRRISIG